MNRNKLQELLVKELLENGQIKLQLPDGMIVELGIVQEGKNGKLVKTDNYSWAIVSQKERTVSMDSHNFGLRYIDESDKMVFQHTDVDKDGKRIRVVDIQ